MSGDDALIVDMSVEALVVNDRNRLGQQVWMRTPMNYNAMPEGGSGAALQSSDPAFTSQQPQDAAFNNGVYLKWRMPKAFRRGAQDGLTGVTTYPRVPNRWLVVRTGGPAAHRGATAWIVESDYAWPGAVSPTNASEQPTLYVGLYGGSVPYGAYIGRNFPLDTATWSETGASLGLTAMGPGNPAFAAYQPQNNNVFSFVDPLGAQGATEQTLSYTVLGWFSSPSDDPLSSPGGGSFGRRLEELGWTLPKGSDPSKTASWSLLAGSVHGVAWQTDKVPPGGPPRVEKPISIALGNTSAEALTAMVAAQGDADDAAMLEALQLGAIDVLDKPDGMSVLEERVKASSFKKHHGGYAWSLVQAPDDKARSDDAARYAQTLARLNHDQASLDAAIRTLDTHGQELLVACWKAFIYPQAVIGVDDPILAPGDLAGLVAGLKEKVAAAQGDVDRLRALVPCGATPKALAQATAAYQDQHGIPASLLLKRSAAQRFHAPNDPVVLLAGAGASGIVRDAGPDLVRFASQLVTGFDCDGTSVTTHTPGLSIPLPDLSKAGGTPWNAALAERLLVEAFFLDPENATPIAAALHAGVASVAASMANPANDFGDRPTGAVARWGGNPWHPLLLMYRSAYFALPYGSGDQPNWRFDGSDYALAASAEAIAQPGLGPAGTLLLTPTAASNMDARLEQFLANNPDLPTAQRDALERLQGFIQRTDAWDLLSQALDGFNDALRLVQPGVFASPTAMDATVARAIGHASANPPGLGAVPSRGQATTTLFQPWRAGQFYMQDLILVDEWGQALWPISDQTVATEAVFLPECFEPVLTSTGASFTVAEGPFITGLSPSLAAAGGDLGVEVTVSGAGFSPSAVVQRDGSALATRHVDDTRLVATLPASDLADAASLALTVREGAAISPAVRFAVTAEAAIGSLSPASAQAGAVGPSPVVLGVAGANFSPSAVVTWNGIALATDYIDAANLQAAIPPMLLAAPGAAMVAVTSDGAASAGVKFTVSDGPVVAEVEPAAVAAGGAGLKIVADGFGFSPSSQLALLASTGGTPLTLATSQVGPTRLTAFVPAKIIASAATFTVVESVGSSISPTLPTSVIQLAPALLQAARLSFRLVSADDDAIDVGPAQPRANPICGWLLPNHLDASLMAYDPSGGYLGEMSVDMRAKGGEAVVWEDGPGSPGLAALAASLPHFGAMLLQLSQVGATTLRRFMEAIDDALWATQPAAAASGKSLAPLIGRPLALVRAALALELDGPPASDPSWQFTLAPAQPIVTSYDFATGLGDAARLDDGLIGYFDADDYTRFNVVQRSDAEQDAFLHEIGHDGNFVNLRFGAAAPHRLSMLVDPRAPVHAKTGILPVVALPVPDNFIKAALSAMKVTFRLDGVLTDERIASPVNGVASTTLLMPLPSERVGRWSWFGADGADLIETPTSPSDATARLTKVAPVLRQGLLQLSTIVGAKDEAS